MSVGRRIYIVKVPCLNGRFFYTGSEKKMMQWEAIPIFMVRCISSFIYKATKRDKEEKFYYEAIPNLPYRTKQNEKQLLKEIEALHGN